MEEEGSGSRSSYRSLKKDIQFSKYMSEVQKHRLLEGKRYGTSPDRRRERILAMARFMEKHKNTKQIESDEGIGSDFLTAPGQITGIMFGRPIILPFSKMLSEYYKERFGVDLKDVVVLRCCEGLPAKPADPDGVQCAKWFHLNYKAKLKDDEKTYFAEVIVFKFRFAPLLCKVITCLPVDHGDGSGTCKCLLLPNCDPNLEHPTEKAYVAGSLMEPSYIPLWNKAKLQFEQLVGNDNISKKGPVRAWLAKPSRENDRFPGLTKQISCKAFPNHRNGTPAAMEEGSSTVAEVPKSYLYPNWNTSAEMSKDIPVPFVVLSEGKRQSNGLAQLQKRTLAIAKHIENCKKPRMPYPPPQIEALSRELSKYCGGDLEALSGFKISEKQYNDSKLSHGRKATLLHMNFSAKHKSDADGVSENLYFAEVVEICRQSEDKNEAVVKYCTNLCVQLDKNDGAGKSSKCGICKGVLQIFHPCMVSYIDDVSKMEPSGYSGWEKVEFVRDVPQTVEPGRSKEGLERPLDAGSSIEVLY